MWRNNTKWKYMFMFPLKNLARKGLRCHQSSDCVLFIYKQRASLIVARVSYLWTRVPRWFMFSLWIDYRISRERGLFIFKLVSWSHSNHIWASARFCGCRFWAHRARTWQSPGFAFIKPDQRNPWIKDQLGNALLSTVLHLQLPNFVSCGRDKPSHMTQNLVTVGTKL